MIYLLIGFLAPALLFVILGFLICLRKPSSRHDEKDYQSLNSSDFPSSIRIPVIVNSSESTSYQMMFENPYFRDFKTSPPSYSDSVSTRNHVKHLPPNQPRLLENRDQTQSTAYMY